MKILNLLPLFNSFVHFLSSQVKSDADLPIVSNQKERSNSHSRIINNQEERTDSPEKRTDSPILNSQEEKSNLALPENIRRDSHVRANDDKLAAAKMSGIFYIFQALGLAIVAGSICSYFKVPVSWLIGPLLVGIALAFLRGSPRPLPKTCLTLGKAIIGVFSASRFSLETLILAKDYAIPLLLCIAIVAGLSAFNGFLMWRLAGVDRLTGFLGTIPGSASNVVTMSEDLGAEPLSVAVFQYARMMLMALLMPVAASWLVGRMGALEASNSLVLDSNSHLVLAPRSLAENLLFLAVCCSLGTLLGKRLRLPASAFLGSFLLGLAVCWLFPNRFYVPRPIFAFALMSVGLSIGLKFDWQTIRRLWRAILLEIGLILMLIAGCLSIGYAFHLVTGIDTVTALLGFVPGALEAMVATATQLGSDTGTVVAIQMTRQLVILFAMNVLTLLLASDRRSNPIGEPTIDKTTNDEASGRPEEIATN